MDYKDYYAVLGIERSADEAAIKRAYRQAARKYHPDVSREADAEARFKEVAEAYEVLKDPERRAAYDRIGRDWGDGRPPPDWDAGYEFGGGPSGHPERDAAFSDFFEALFGAHGGHAQARADGAGEDHHAKVLIDLEDAFRGATQTMVLNVPEHDARGRLRWRERRLEVQIPRGIRAGQRLRLTGQGGPGAGRGPAGDLYLEIGFKPHPVFHVDGRDLSLTLPLAPWEAALGTTVVVPAPAGPLELRVPPNSAAGQRLRLKGQGLPGQPPGDLYAQLAIVLPPADTEQRRDAYRTFGAAFEFDPRPGFHGARS